MKNGSTHERPALVRYPRGSALLVAVGVMAGCASYLLAQTPAGSASFSARVGLGAGGAATAIAGLELRIGERLPFAISIGVDKWLRSVDCPALPGISCDDQAWAYDVGVVARLKQLGRSMTLYAAPRVGVLYYHFTDRRVWKPGLGVGLTWSGRSAFGWMAEARYEALTGARWSGQGSRPNTDDHLAFLAGLRLRL